MIRRKYSHMNCLYVWCISSDWRPRKFSLEGHWTSIAGIVLNEQWTYQSTLSNCTTIIAGKGSLSRSDSKNSSRTVGTPCKCKCINILSILNFSAEKKEPTTKDSSEKSAGSRSREDDRDKRRGRWVYHQGQEQSSADFHLLFFWQDYM